MTRTTRLLRLSAAALAAMLHAWGGSAQAGPPNCSESSATPDVPSVRLCPLGDADSARIEIQLIDFWGLPSGAQAESVYVRCPGAVGFPLSDPDDMHMDANAYWSEGGEGNITFARFGHEQAGLCRIGEVVLGSSFCTTPLTPTSLTLRFFDLNGDGVVSGPDFAVFAGHWQTTDPTVDYDESELVDGVDFAHFAAHWLHDGR